MLRNLRYVKYSVNNLRTIRRKYHKAPVIGTPQDVNTATYQVRIYNIYMNFLELTRVLCCFFKLLFDSLLDLVFRD